MQMYIGPVRDTLQPLTQNVHAHQATKFTLLYRNDYVETLKLCKVQASGIIKKLDDTLNNYMPRGIRFQEVQRC